MLVLLWIAPEMIEQLQRTIAMSEEKPGFVSLACIEPFRVFFPLALIMGVLGVCLWPLYYGGCLSYYPMLTHARVMVECFVGGFALGFLTTALPKMRGVLIIAFLLRFMDSFMIYTEPFVLTGGGPGNSTTFMSIDLVKKAIGQFDLGPAAAMSLIYQLIIILICYVFFTVMSHTGADKPEQGAGE